VNRRRILVAFLGVGLIVVAILLFPSLHKLSETPIQQAEQPQVPPQPSPAETVSTTPAPTAARPLIPPVITVAKAAPALPQATISVNGVNDIDPAKAFGSKSAPVVMEIFSDFQCPACKQLFTTTTQKVMDNYVNTGKVYLIHRDYPLPMHAYSRVAASYSRAAAHIGRCEEVEQAIFQNQEKWEMNGDIQGTVATALSPAEMKKVQALVEAKTFEPLIEKDRHLGQLVPVNQTPYTVLHTKSGQTFPVVGFVSYDVLKTFLDQLVSQK
jgi:protein-disulfide isomerase